MFETLENNHSTDGLTDIYESQAVLVIQSNIIRLFFLMQILQLKSNT